LVSFYIGTNNLEFRSRPTSLAHANVHLSLYYYYYYYYKRMTLTKTYSSEKLQGHVTVNV